jgi:hypothetical protein
MPHDCTLGAVVGELLRHPIERILRKWHYKAAVTSALIRGLLFLLTNLSAGWAAAASASLTELVFRFATSGFYGALTQALRSVQPPRIGLLAALIALPAIAHTLELALHWARGTPELAFSIVASMCLTALSTSFNLFVMRRGVLIVGEEDRHSLVGDLKRMPAMLAMFVQSIIRHVRLVVAGALP